MQVSSLPACSDPRKSYPPKGAHCCQPARKLGRACLGLPCGWQLLQTGDHPLACPFPPIPGVALPTPNPALIQLLLPTKCGLAGIRHRQLPMLLCTGQAWPLNAALVCCCCRCCRPLHAAAWPGAAAHRAHTNLHSARPRRLLPLRRPQLGVLGNPSAALCHSSLGWYRSLELLALGPHCCAVLSCTGLCACCACLVCPGTALQPAASTSVHSRAHTVNNMWAGATATACCMPCTTWRLLSPSLSYLLELLTRRATTGLSLATPSRFADACHCGTNSSQ